MVELIHKEVTSQIIAAAYEVSNQLGVGFLEKVYENAMKVELKHSNKSLFYTKVRKLDSIKRI